MARTKIPLIVFRDNGTFAANASVVVNNRSNGQQAVVYSSEGGAVLAQPLACDSRGRCPGWVDRGAYEAVCSGTGVTSYNEQFDSAPASDLSIDRAWLADAAVNTAKMADSTVTPAKLQADTLPVGTVALFWRVAAGAPLPVNYVAMEGQSLAAGQHDFPVAGAVVLPDMRNRFALGADKNLALGAAGSAETAGGVVSTGRAPGIGGVVSGHSVDITHSHTIPGHKHSRGDMSISQTPHAHGFSTYGQPPGVTFPNAAATDGTTLFTGNSDGQGGGSTTLKLTNQASYFGGIAITGGNANVSLTGTVGNVGSSVNGDNDYTSYNGSGLLDKRPGSIGLLFIIKVKNT